MGRLQEVAGEIKSLVRDQAKNNARLGKIASDAVALAEQADTQRREAEGTALMLQGLHAEVEAIIAAMGAVGGSVVQYSVLAAEVKLAELDAAELAGKLEGITRYQGDVADRAKEAHERGTNEKARLDRALAIADALSNPQ